MRSKHTNIYKNVAKLADLARIDNIFIQISRQCDNIGYNKFLKLINQ